MTLKALIHNNCGYGYETIAIIYKCSYIIDMCAAGTLIAWTFTPPETVEAPNPMESF